jgi:hypothetical protein
VVSGYIIEKCVKYLGVKLRSRLLVSGICIIFMCVCVCVVYGGFRWAHIRMREVRGLIIGQID